MRMWIRDPEIFFTLDLGSGREKIQIRDKIPDRRPLVDYLIGQNSLSSYWLVQQGVSPLNRGVF
jgi:hypothetical protein